MNNPYSAYSTAMNIVASGRDIEAGALEKAAKFLHEAHNNPSDREFLEQAVSVNSRIWALLVQGVSADDSLLDDKMQAAIVSLGIYINKASLAALAGETEKLKSIIQINIELASGLRTHAE